MAVPCLQARYGGKAPERVGLKHPTIAPCGAFTWADGRDPVLSIRNERGWAAFRRGVLQRPGRLQGRDNAACVANRGFVDGTMAEVFAAPASATMTMPVHGQAVEMPAAPLNVAWEAAAFPPAPTLDAQGAAIRAEFSAPAAAARAPAPPPAPAAPR